MAIYQDEENRFTGGAQTIFPTNVGQFGPAYDSIQDWRSVFGLANEILNASSDASLVLKEMVELRNEVFRLSQEAESSANIAVDAAETVQFDLKAMMARMDEMMEVIRDVAPSAEEVKKWHAEVKQMQQEIARLREVYLGKAPEFPTIGPQGIPIADGALFYYDGRTYNNGMYLYNPEYNNPLTGKWELLSAEGIRGVQGPEGIQGPPGPQGIQGIQGIEGPQGIKGPEGPIGVQGPQGIMGPRGDRGPAGEQGIQGDLGPTGPIGPEGIQGPQGIAPAHQWGGVVGEESQLRFENSDGTWGDWRELRGPEGPEGPEGERGPQGVTGPQGPRGFEGPIGPEGIQGPRGDRGPQGDQGIQGNTGNTGPTGPQGVEGPTGSAPAHRWTGTAGQESQLQFKNPDGTWGITRDLKGPEGRQGPQGARGSQGVQGVQGPAGEAGTSFDVDATIETDAERAPYDTMLRGFSVLSLGHLNPSGTNGAISIKLSDTAGDWSAWLPFGQGPQGEQGPEGVRGPQGPEGATGPQGAQGAKGPQGDVGATGPQGSKGPQGEIGPRGLKGDKGIQGDMGPMGPEGDRGVTGARGAEGPQGVQGEQGLRGIQGPEGKRGPQGTQGAKGPQGDVGGVGPRGPEGPQGIRGPQGLKGDKGETGDMGPMGPEGDRGLQGEQGLRGTAGPQGRPGIDGQQGKQGEIGPRGPQGEEGRRGPQGFQGPDGPKGPPGNRGAAGINGKNGTDGTDGTDGKNGTDGIDGRSVEGYFFRTDHVKVPWKAYGTTDQWGRPVGPSDFYDLCFFNIEKVNYNRQLVVSGFGFHVYSSISDYRSLRVRLKCTLHVISDDEVLDGWVTVQKYQSADPRWHPYDAPGTGTMQYFHNSYAIFNDAVFHVPSNFSGKGKVRARVDVIDPLIPYTKPEFTIGTILDTFERPGINVTLQSFGGGLKPLAPPNAATKVGD